MTIGEYQHEALKTAVYPTSLAVMYPALGLAGEAGEVANKVKKIFRDDNGEVSVERANQIAKEIGGVLWYCAALANDIGISLEFIAKQNLQELASRQARGTLHGSGDDR